MQEIFISITLVFSSLFVNVLHNGASEFMDTGFISSTCTISRDKCAKDSYLWKHCDQY